MRIQNKMLIALFIFFIGGIGIWNVVVEDNSFSEQENRVLAQRPTFTIKRFLSGDFTEDFEEYMTDQFTAKSFWLAVGSIADKLTLKKEHDGVYFGKDDFLLERYEQPGEQLQKNIESILHFASKTKEAKTYCVIAPTSVEVYREKLPLFAQSYNQYEVLTDVYNQLSPTVTMTQLENLFANNENEQLYFRTDHHWTMLGAYEAYVETVKSMGITPYSKKDFQIETVSSTFLGTLYSKANAFGISPDYIEVFMPTFPIAYRVTYENETVSSDSLYEYSYLDKKDQYSFFLNGNHSLVKIQSSVKNNRKLLVIKDSYAHAFIPFLANHFEEIYVVDLRYYHDSVYTYMKNNDLKETLFLYNVANFSTDKNMIWLHQ
ncbi:MAG: DHHW family protein [Bacillus sp. (in: firmicutes)]